MNDTAIKNFCMWARRELMAGVKAKAHYYGIREDGYEPVETEVLHGEVVLTPEERKQRKGLIQLYEAKDKNYGAFIEQAAYTWFNRIMAIRFMELNDKLPSHTRIFSLNDGSFGSQAVAEALDIQIEGVDQARVLEYKQAGDDEALFRHLFLVQCNELSSCMPQVFDPVGSALELLLPNGLLRKGSVIERMVADIPEEDWREGVEIVGWMYQYYNAERKDEVFASFKKGKKADKESIAPATQLFTPPWIVQYLTDNSLGRLWMLNHPNSKLVDQMKYYLAPDEESHEVPQKVESPEEITICDPACGSGHILVYAFDLLAAMYEEAGYSHRDIPRLVLENNLTGFEIDPRAAEMASFALTMKGCEWDRRFLRRDVQPEIVVLQSVVFEPEELDLLPELAGEKKLLDTLAHLSECGSLFLPTDEEVAVLRQSLEKLQARASLFSAKAEEKLVQAIYLCEQLQRKFSVTIANPPYMGSSNMDKWLAKWTAKHYTDTKRDLCTCFIERGFSLAVSEGYSSMITMQSWMFLGSFEAMRKHLIDNVSIAEMAHLGTRAFASIGGEVVSTTATVVANKKVDVPGEYLRLIDFENEREKEAAIIEAIDNPDCGWFYRRRAEDFKVIPGSPIAYWASDAILEAFKTDCTFKSITNPRVGMQTGDNERFLREWWEVSRQDESLNSTSQLEFNRSKAKWAAYNKGGSFRKWYGNLDYVLNWENEGYAIRLLEDGEKRTFSVLPQDRRFVPTVTWSDVTSSSTHFRYRPSGSLYDIKGMSCFPSETMKLPVLGFANSSVASAMLKILSPTMNNQVGDVGKLPILFLDSDERIKRISKCVAECVEESRKDWDLQETSWNFVRSPLMTYSGKQDETTIEYNILSREWAIRTINAIAQAYSQECNLDLDNQAKWRLALNNAELAVRYGKWSLDRTTFICLSEIANQPYVSGGWLYKNYAPSDLLRRENNTVELLRMNIPNAQVATFDFDDKERQQKFKNYSPKDIKQVLLNWAITVANGKEQRDIPISFIDGISSTDCQRLSIDLSKYRLV